MNSGLFLHLGVRRFVAAAMLAGGLASVSSAQYAERPALFGSGSGAVDVSGRSIKDARVRAVHTTDPNLPGGTAYLFQRDPYLAYQLGRNLNFLEFTEKHGTFDGKVSNLRGTLSDGTTRKITANNQTSCLGCHNLPAGNPGGGPNFSKDSGFGRNSPHYYGAGLVEMFAIQTRAEMLLVLDTNQDGWVSVGESQAAATTLPIRIHASTPVVDYGNPRLTNGATGKPQLNNIFRVWYVDSLGRFVPGATQVDGVATVGYSFEMVVWGFGHGPGRNALNPTNRAFLWDPWKTHGGLEACDPSTRNDPDANGVSAPTLAGCIQFPATHKAADGGSTMDPMGFSRDDPDGDGYLNEISEGDLDLAEWFMLNAPRPAFAGTQAEYDAGVRALTLLQCTSCHVANWDIAPKSTVNTGDRRFFDLDAKWNATTKRLEGRLVPLYTQVGQDYVRNFGGFEVKGFFSDLRHHDMGDGFKEIDFGGTVNKVWRTSPLWGVGSGFPWGHDGQSLTIEDAILRHGGAAAASRAAWDAAPAIARSTVLSFLSKLVLYDIESLPADIDGNGAIASNFVVATKDTGVERFNAEWLFNVPLRIQGFVTNAQGQTITSYAGTNIADAYGQNLLYRLDYDKDCWPDVWDTHPVTPGFKNGQN